MTELLKIYNCWNKKEIITIKERRNELILRLVPALHLSLSLQRCCLCDKSCEASHLPALLTL
jgi:hypothetical protein